MHLPRRRSRDQHALGLLPDPSHAKLRHVTDALPPMLATPMGVPSIVQSPPIYVRLDGPMRLSLGGRLLATLIAGGALGVLVVAAWLDPSPRGFGTHTQLGLQPCAFLQRTGLPCASCGMTTSFAWLVHGHPINSFIAQPFGLVLCILTAVAFWSGLYVAVTGKPSYRLLNTIPHRVHLMVWIPMALAAWAWKIALTVMY